MLKNAVKLIPGERYQDSYNKSPVKALRGDFKADGLKIPKGLSFYPHYTYHLAVDFFSFSILCILTLTWFKVPFLTHE